VSRRKNVQKSLRPQGSRLLHLIDRATSRPAVVVVLLAADAAWVLYSALVGFPSRLELVFQTLVGALTVAMVFVIQHTQAREQVTTQRKLDEILNALPHADKTLIALEDATDTELASARATHRSLREEAIERPDPPSSPVTRPEETEEAR
jgi:low affinity Fe/Cu permease